VKSLALASFWRAYGRLDARTQEAARRGYLLFNANPSHPSLRFKRLAGHDRLWSVRINDQYRAVGERSGEVITWFWIGTHNEFDHLFS
jgi:hypothetical protein